MSRGKELIKNTGILFVAKISTQIISFLLLPLYTALLTAEEYGQVDIYASLAMILIPFITLQLEMGLFRYFAACEDKTERREILSSAYMMLSILIVLSSLVYLVTVILFDITYAGLLFGYYLSQVLFIVLMQTCRAMGDNKGYGLAAFLSSSLAMFFNVLFIAGLNWKVEGILLSSIIAQLFSCVFLICRTRVVRYLDYRSVKFGQCRRLLKYSVPLIFNQISSWLINYSDRLLILYYWGQGANGIYSIANKFSNIINVFFGLYNTAWTENVVRGMNDEDNNTYVSNIFEITFQLYFILITAIINVLPFVFGLFVNVAFEEAYQHIPILLLAMLFSGMAATIGSLYIAFEKTKEVSITTLLAGVCNIIIHYVLLKVCGLYAASVSTLLAFGLLFVYRYIHVRSFFCIKCKINKIVLQFLVYIFCWLAYVTKNSYIIICGIIINLWISFDVIKNNKQLLMIGFKKHTN